MRYATVAKPIFLQYLGPTRSFWVRRAYKNFGSPKARANRQDSIVDVLLGDIYDRFNVTLNKNENLMDSEVFHSEFSASSSRLSGSDVDAKHARTSLENLSKQATSSKSSSQSRKSMATAACFSSFNHQAPAN